MSLSSRQPLPLAFLLGFVTMAAQAILFREHLLVYAGNEIGMGAFLAAWMLWIGVGALVGRGPAGRSDWLARWTLLLLPLSGAVELLMFWHLRRSAGVPVGGVFPHGDLLLWTAVAALPLSGVAGYLFTWLARTTESSEGARAGAVLRVYAVEALGSAAGGLALTAACWAGLATTWLIIGVGLVWWAGLAVVLRRVLSPFSWLAGTLTALLLVAAASGLPEMLEDGRRRALPIPSQLVVEATVDTPYQHLAIARIGEARIVLSNGDVAGLFPDDSAVLDAATLHTLAPPSPRTLVVGLGAPALVCELVRRSQGEVVYVGVDRTGLDFVLEWIPELGECLNHPRLKIVSEAPQRYLDRVERASFDLVVYSVPEPRTAQSARFYSAEFVADIAAVLSDDGLFSFAATATENVLAGPVLQYIAGLHQTLAHVFWQVHFTAGEQMRFFAGKRGANLTTDSDALEARFESLRSSYPELQPEFFATRFERLRITELRTLLGALPPVPLITRNRPGVFLQKILGSATDLSWLATLARPGAGLLGTVLLGLGALLAALLLAASRKREAGRLVPLSMLVVAGLVGMAGQVLILLGYQSRFGTLFAEFGLLNALFLAGLAAGGLIPWWRSKLLRKLVPMAPAAASLGLVGMLGIEAVGWSLRGVMMAAPLVLGIGVGAGLSVAMNRLQALGDSRHRLAVSLEFLDHSGAVIGALLAGTFLIPICGLVDTGWLLVGIGLIPAILAGAEAAGWHVSASDAVPGTTWRIALIWGLLLAALSPLLPSAGGELQPNEATNSLVPASADEPTDPRSSWPECVTIPGWGGPLELLVERGDDGSLLAVQLGRQRETPEYLYGIDEWLDTLRGKSAIELCYDCPGSDASVDAFTGATVTGEAIVAIVRCVADPHRATGVESTTGGPDPGGGFWRIEVVIALLLLLVGGSLYWTGWWRARLVLLLVIAASSGIWLNQQLSVPGLMAVVAGPRPPGENTVLWLLCGGALFWGILGGAIHCGYLCPAGAAMSWISRVGLRWRPPRRWDRALRQVKYGGAAIIVWGLVLMPGTDWAAADLLRYLFRGRYDALGFGLLLLVVAATAIWLRPWCRYLCPLGALISLCEKYAIGGRLAPRRQSAQCHHGVEVGRDLDCLRCNHCVGQALPPSRFHRPALSRVLVLLFLVAIVALGGLRVVTQTGRSTPRMPAPSHPAVLPVSPEQPTAPSPETVGPRLFRKDNDAYPVQRRPGADQLEKWLRNGDISGKEASFFVPVPERSD